MILQSLDALEKDLESSAGRTCYLILGPEQYLCRLAVDRIKNRILGPETRDFDLSTYSAKDTAIEKIFETANTFPMLSSRRLVLVTEIDKLADSEHEALLHSLDTLPARSLLILVADELDHRKKLYKHMRDKGCIAEFSKLKGGSLEHWVEAFIHRRGYRISSATTRKIVNLAGSDLQSLVAEMEKLLLFTGEEKQISDTAVDDLVQNRRQHGIFELIDALGLRNRAGSLDSLSSLLHMGESPLGIVAMMARHTRQVFIVKESIQKGKTNREAGNAAQVPPFLLEKFIRQARGMDLETVREMHIRLHEIDRRLKSSSMDARILLEAFICAFS